MPKCFQWPNIDSSYQESWPDNILKSIGLSPVNIPNGQYMFRLTTAMYCLDISKNDGKYSGSIYLLTTSLDTPSKHCYTTQKLPGNIVDSLFNILNREQLPFLLYQKKHKWDEYRGTILYKVELTRNGQYTSSNFYGLNVWNEFDDIKAINTFITTTEKQLSIDSLFETFIKTLPDGRYIKTEGTSTTQVIGKKTRINRKTKRPTVELSTWFIL